MKPKRRKVVNLLLTEEDNELAEQTRTMLQSAYLVTSFSKRRLQAYLRIYGDLCTDMAFACSTAVKVTKSELFEAALDLSGVRAYDFNG